MINPRKSVVPGLLAALAAGLAMMTAGLTMPMVVTGATAILCVSWWIFEPIPIPVTSLLPLALMPMFGVLTPTETGAAYGSPLILLLLGGFLLSRGMESSGAHRRLALGVVRLVGWRESSAIDIGFHDRGGGG